MALTKDNWIIYFAIFSISVIISYSVGRINGFDEGVGMMQPFLDSSRESQDKYFNKWIDCQDSLIRIKYER